MKKREFIKNLGLMGISPLIPRETSLNNSSNEIILFSKTDSDDDFWTKVRSHYDLHPDFINLESGYYNIIPKPTLENHIKHIKRVNLEGSFYMRSNRFKDKNEITSKLSEIVGCNSENLVITRNTTESLDLVISGFNWEKGDQAVYALQDYGAMQDMFEQISERHGVILQKVSVPNHPKNDKEIVSLYESKINSSTKLILVSHMINITGQILPIKKICKMAHKHGVKVLVDGAHCIGHFQFKIDDLGCDYYGSSLHKWLATPLGAGLLYVANESISQLWPLMADHEKNPNKIKRLSHTGTHPVHTDLAIVDAIEYLKWMNLERKEKRLRFLKNYWQDALKKVPNVVINTPFDSKRSCGIGNVGISKMKPELLAQKLFKEFKIFTVAIDYANVQGCRITPNVFTTIAELDYFIKAIKTLSNA